MRLAHTWPLGASLAVHGLALWGLAGRHEPPPAPRAVEVLILEVGTTSAQGPSASAPDAHPGAPRRLPRRAPAIATRQPEPKVAGLDEQEQELQAPTGSGAGELGPPRLGRGDSSALVWARVQHVADLLSGSRARHEVLLSFDVDARGYVVGYQHGEEIEPVLHLAEPFEAGHPAHYEFPIAY